jgi:D-tagatose-1,6-bisphosphate aldolase subunit GatZ/KbaZ
MVLEAALIEAKSRGDALLVEATSNQVNQFGGYTDMCPSDFADYIRSLATAAGFPLNRLIVGADHLGPHPWKNMPTAQAMQRAVTLAMACVKAGFNKIHLDTGVECADDPSTTLSLETIAERSAILCRAAESEARRQPTGRPLPLYVIGAEVPSPGGSLESTDNAEVTSAEDVVGMIEGICACFRRNDLADAWERVVAVVVQPGVDFGDRHVSRYRPEKAAELSAYHANLPGIMTYEVHAADYQTPDALMQMIRDHFTILKVGPCLTNAYREAIFALSHIETAWLEKKKGYRLSGISDSLASAMQAKPEHWQTHYRGSAAEVDFMRQYSFRDRIRYYWSSPEVVASVGRLLNNLNRPIPRTLLSQYFPDFYPVIQTGELRPAPLPLIRQRIRSALVPYTSACHPISIRL